MRRYSLAVMAAMMVLAARAAEGAGGAGGAEAEPRSVSTVGEATVYVVPDRVYVTLGVETYDANLDPAKSRNEAQAAKLVAAIGGMGIEKKDIGTDNVQVTIHYDSGLQRLTAGYTVRRTYAVTLRDVKQFEALIDTALKNGANRIEQVTFNTTALRKYRDQARQMAIKAAKEKAVALAKELDGTVGKPLTIQEGGGYLYYGGYRSRGDFGNSQVSVQAPSTGDDTGENLPLGQIAVQASVSVKFALE
jgi:uncharacterized protein YggE